jgi:maleamate amidohydrolase
MRKTTDLSPDDGAVGFGGALSPGRRPALILVDFARAYFDPASPLFADVSDARANAARLVTAAHAAGVPVIFTRVEYVAGDPARDGGIFYRKLPALTCFDRGNPLGDFTPELAPAPDDRVITKCFPSAFFGTGLAETLHGQGIDTCVIAGLSTSGCVRATAVDALCHGFIPLVVADACGDRDDRVHDANIFDLRAKYAEIVATDAMIAYFGSVASSTGRAAENA